MNFLLYYLAMFEAVNNLIANFILFVQNSAQGFIENVNYLQFSWIQIAADILIVGIFVYYLVLILKGTRALNIAWGVMILGMIYLISKVFSLVAVSWLFEKFLTLVIIAIPIIFQQELRRALERLGKTKLFMSHIIMKADILISQVVSACADLVEKNRGALIVFERDTPLKEYIDTGIALDSDVSKELIVSIFNDKSPLHDGAIIIKDNKIKAASCILPHSFKTYGKTLGTRHRAALALSESTDAKIIAISEERNSISFIENGAIDQNLNAQKLELLLGFLKPKEKKHYFKNKQTK